MKKTKLARAVEMTLIGGALSMGVASSASALTMYNTDHSSVDGRLITFVNGQAAYVPWLGTTGGALPFGYTGSQALNWAVLIEGNDPLQNKETISAADALGNYAADAKIDVGSGSWFDGTTGWGMFTDYGLIKSDVDTVVTIAAKSLDPANTAQLGFTLFTGMDTGVNYDHHSPWNTVPTYTYGYMPRTTSNPFNTENVIYLGHAAPDEGNYNAATGETIYTLSLLAGQVYSMYLGGFRSSYNGGYEVTFTPTSAVPIPAGAWLMGGALLTLFGKTRRKWKTI